jgi:hypothetical protein
MLAILLNEIQLDFVQNIPWLRSTGVLRAILMKYSVVIERKTVSMQCKVAIYDLTWFFSWEGKT